MTTLDEDMEQDRRLSVNESKLEDLQIRIDRLEEKIDYLIHAEADRKAQDKILEKYGKAAFWGVVSVGGLINWDKITELFRALFHN